MIAPIFNKNNLKLMCVCAYTLEKITEIEIDLDHENTKIKLDIKNNNTKAFNEIKEIIIQNKFTYNRLYDLAKKYPIIVTYYNTIFNTVKERSYEDEYWTPGIVLLSLIQEYSIKTKSKLFKHIDFNKATDNYIEDKNSEYYKNMKLATTIIQRLEAVDANKKQSKKKK